MTTPGSRTPVPLQDARGCLTAVGLETFRSSAAGRAPKELASHLAACPRCQQRVLAVDAPRSGSRRARPNVAPPSLGRALLLAVLVVAAVVAALVTLRQLAP